MANPSTTGPSGIGSEVLRRKGLQGLSDTSTNIITVGTDMIVTVLSLFIVNNSGTASKTFDLQVSLDGGSGVLLLKAVPLNENETYVFNDKFVMTETDVLQVSFNSTDHDIYVSYIEQEFA